jgi:hypothetical protein
MTKLSDETGEGSGKATVREIRVTSPYSYESVNRLSLVPHSGLRFESITSWILIRSLKL